MLRGLTILWSLFCEKYETVLDDKIDTNSFGKEMDFANLLGECLVASKGNEVPDPMEVVMEKRDEKPSIMEIEAMMYKFFFPNYGITPVEFMKGDMEYVYGIFVGDLCIKYARSLEDRIGLKSCSRSIRSLQDRIGTEGQATIKDKESVDVIGLLRGGGFDARSDSGARTGYLVNNKGVEVPLEVLKNKHVIIACLAAPLISGTLEAAVCHALFSLDRSAIWSVTSCQIVLVIVGRREEKHEEADFNHLFSGFRETVLAIPYSNVELRKDLYRYLSVSLHPYEDGVIVDRHGKIVQHSLRLLVEYGPVCFPFSRKDVRKHEASRQTLKARLDIFSYSKDSPLDEKNDYLGIRNFPTLTLSELVSNLPQMGPAGVRHKLSRFPGLDYHVPLDTLDGRLVGLYLCGDGHLMKTLEEIQEQCSNLIPQFEIVVVPVALVDHNHSSVYHIRRSLSHLNISSWWTLYPYNDMITRILPSIFGFFGRDKLILLPSADTHSGDMQAGAVLSFLKYRNRLNPSVYPFTKERLFHEKFDALSTVSSLLEEFKHEVIPCEGGGPVTLQSKNILLYFNPFDLCGDLEDCWGYFLVSFPTFEEDYPDCQVVCVFPGIDPEDEFLADLPWLMISRPAEADKILRKALFLDQPGMDDSPFIVPFGKDGRVCSTKVLENTSEVPAASLFEPKLRREIFREVVSQIKAIAGPAKLYKY